MGNFPDKRPNWKVMLHYWEVVISHFPIFTTQLDVTELLSWLGQHQPLRPKISPAWAGTAGDRGTGSGANSFSAVCRYTQLFVV